MNDIREKLIAAGVKNLKEFGYPDCNKINIFTDMIYKKMFVSMLKENKGHGETTDNAIDELIVKCNAFEGE